MEDLMRFSVVAPALIVLVCGFSAPASWADAAGQRTSLTQRHGDISAAKRDRSRHQSGGAPTTYAPRNYRGADPSIWRDGKPYRVPEYLRNQCYVDDGYGRFSACSNL
jgi:hypothetical protein